jgi:hypothetical protein
MIDLHVHTTVSDGTLTPREVVRLAAAKGLSAIAITDHDTVMGVSEAQEEGALADIEVVAGVEISSRSDKGVLHILGYFVDVKFPRLLKRLDFLKRGRLERIPQMLEKLKGLGISIREQDVLRETGGGVPGRPHIAVIMARRGYVSTPQEAFDYYLRKGGPAYVKKAKLAPGEAVRLIRQAGGVPVIAHPYLLGEKDTAGLEQLVGDLVSHGLGGIEVYYPEHTLEQTQAYLEVVRRFGLAITGGTDFHGANKPGVALGVIPGVPPLSASLLEDLRSRKGSA